MVCVEKISKESLERTLIFEQKYLEEFLEKTPEESLDKLLEEFLKFEKKNPENYSGINPRVIIAKKFSKNP